MSKSQRRIVTHLKEIGLAQQNEHNECLREIGIFSIEEFKEKPLTDRRRIISLLYDLGYNETAHYLKTIKI